MARLTLRRPVYSDSNLVVLVRSSGNCRVEGAALLFCAVVVCLGHLYHSLTMKLDYRLSLVALLLCAVLHLLRAQAPTGPATPPPAVPAWAQPGSPTHTQVAPPLDFHRPTKSFDTPVGIFEGQSDIGGPLLPGSASYDAATKTYTINSAGYNVWYTRDEFRYLWKKMSGDVSLAADISFPDPNGYGDRKAFVIIRQSLDDDSKEAMVALHGAGMVHLAQRPEKSTRVKDMEFRMGSRGRPGGASPDSLVVIVPKRIGIEKRGDSFAVFMSLDGEPMHQFGPPIQLHLDEPFYVGIGFCSHQPDKSDTAILSNVVLENSAGKVR
ncbi:biopolymer transporter Tol [Edaphobacter aggregans]|nr:biopolymer transporter Tol [Edaphobacter aggregans]